MRLLELMFKVYLISNVVAFICKFEGVKNMYITNRYNDFFSSNHPSLQKGVQTTPNICKDSLLSGSKLPVLIISRDAFLL